MKKHPIQFVRFTGILDGISLITLLLIAMPLKYNWGIDIAVTINGMAHGFIFMLYLGTIVYAQLRVRWAARWTIACIAVAFIPFANFVLDPQLRKITDRYPVQSFEKVWIVYLIVFFAFIDLFAQLPVMSTYALSVGATAFVAGIVVGLYSFTNTFGNIFSGILTDRIGSFNMIVIGLTTTVVAIFSYQFVTGPEVLLVIRCIHGFTSGLITPAAFTLLANTRKETKQGSGGAITGSFVGTAAIIGPATSGILANQTSVPNVLGLVGCYGFVLIVAMFIFLRGSRDKKEKTEKVTVKLEWNVGIWKAFGGAFFLMFSQGVLAYLLSIYVESLGYSSRLSGTLLSTFGIVAVIIFISPINRIFDKVHSQVTFFIGIAVIGCSQILIGQSEAQFALYGVLALYGVGFAFLFPSINALLVESTTAETRGKAYGYFYAFFSLGVVAGSSVLGMLGLELTDGFLFTGCVLLAFSASILMGILQSKQFLKVVNK